jgi:hypothetical protein
MRRTSWRGFFFLAALEAGAAFVVLARVPSEGLSPIRFLLLGLLFLFFAVALYFGFRPPEGLDSLARPPSILAAAILALTLGLTLFLLRFLDPDRLLPFYVRLSPLLWCFLVLSIQFVLLLLFLQNGIHPRMLMRIKPVYQTAVIVFCVLLAAFGFVAFTRLGLTPDPAYWAEHGVPLQGWQFAVALIAGSFAFWFSFSKKN